MGNFAPVAIDMKPRTRLPELQSLARLLPSEELVRLELEDGIPIFRASEQIQTTIDSLLAKQQDAGLSTAEHHQLDGYEELNDYLTFVNHTLRNLYLT
ncbi:MAG: hypothetical protein AAGF24_06320 [Cyanobacteria bacterium P01_H01_bin.121]